MVKKHRIFLMCLAIAVFSGFSAAASLEMDLSDTASLSDAEVVSEFEIINPPSVTTYVYEYKSILKGIVKYDNSDIIHNRITMFGVLNPNSFTSFNYGILFKKADAFYETMANSDMVVGAPGVSKYPAQAPYILPYYIYGVSLHGEMLDEGMFYMRPYVEYTINGETVYSYGRVANTVLQKPIKEDLNEISSDVVPAESTEDISDIQSDLDTGEDDLTDTTETVIESTEDLGGAEE